MTDTVHSAVPMERIMALFEVAAGLGPEERAAFIESVRRSDPDAGTELESLLAAYEPTGHFLMPLDLGRAAALLGLHEDEDNTGTHIGAYRIVRELGRGGMGVVYVAERVDGQFDQQVALKLIKRGMDSDEIQRRFLIERQILAQLSHPNIARLLDGGVTKDGQPFFAMEYIKGAPLIEYCESRRLPIAERLQLFLAVCRAVQHAHSNLVVHRDIKPSNILVTDDAEPKLLDFGIAKLLEPDASGQMAMATRTALRPLSPEYASPEQIRGALVTTASDVYQLGLLLYRLLTGVSPFVIDRGDTEATARAICEATPANPSSVVSAAVGTSFGLSPRRLARRLTGDLDNIVLMALRKEPERRYESAAQLAGDLESYLVNRPVLAQRDSPGYRAVKFVQRHKLSVASSAILILALLAGIAGTTWQARVAAQEAARAAQIKNFTLDLLELSDPDAARGHNLTVAKLLATGPERVETELAGQPALQAEMLIVLGGVHRKLGNYKVARPALERALALRRTIFGPRELPIAESLSELGRLHYQISDYVSAESLLRQALDIRKEHLGGRHVEVADVLEILASVVRSRGELEEAGALIGESLAIRRESLGPRHPAVADSLTELGVLARRRDDLDAAQKYHEEALSIRWDAFGELHYRVADSLKNLALVFHSRENFSQAEGYYRDALSIQRAVLGDDHPSIATTFNSLASLLRTIGELEESRGLFEAALKIERGMLGDDDSVVARTLTNYGALLFDLGEFDPSLATLREALTIKKRTLGPDHPSTATSLNNLAAMLGDLERPDEAWPLVQEAAEIYRRRLGPKHTFFAIALANQARFELDAGLHVEAEAHAIEAYTVLSSASPDQNINLANSQLRLGEVYLKTGRATLALPLLREAAEYFRAMDTPHKLLAESENSLGAALSALGQATEAQDLLLSSYDQLNTRGARVRRLALLRLITHYQSSQNQDKADYYRTLLAGPDPGRQ